jgi:hypothetical protein
MPETLIDEKIEVSIGRRHLQLYGLVSAVLLSLAVYFLHKFAENVEKLTTVVQELVIYSKTSDQRIFFLEKQYSEHIVEFREHKKECNHVQ